ncbi:MAG: hypothetical protein ABIA21_03055 [Candidatus Aenigmatarchaeota archaeon]
MYNKVKDVVIDVAQNPEGSTEYVIAADKKNVKAKKVPGQNRRSEKVTKNKDNFTILHEVLRDEAGLIQDFEVATPEHPLYLTLAEPKIDEKTGKEVRDENEDIVYEKKGKTSVDAIITCNNGGVYGANRKNSDDRYGKTDGYRKDVLRMITDNISKIAEDRYGITIVSLGDAFGKTPLHENRWNSGVRDYTQDLLNDKITCNMLLDKTVVGDDSDNAQADAVRRSGLTANKNDDSKKKVNSESDSEVEYNTNCFDGIRPNEKEYCESTGTCDTRITTFGDMTRYLSAILDRYVSRYFQRGSVSVDDDGDVVVSGAGSDVRTIYDVGNDMSPEKRAGVAARIPPFSLNKPMTVGELEGLLRTDMARWTILIPGCSDK